MSSEFVDPELQGLHVLPPPAPQPAQDDAAQDDDTDVDEYDNVPRCPTYKVRLAAALCSY